MIKIILIKILKCIYRVNFKILYQVSVLLDKIVVLGLTSLALFLFVVGVMCGRCVRSCGCICTVFSCFCLLYWFLSIVSVSFKKLLNAFLS